MFKIIALFALFAVIFGQEDTNKVNEIIDNLINQKREDLKQLKTPGFKYDVDIPLTASPAVINLDDGPITGLDGLKRVDSKFRKTADGMEEYTVKLGTENINVNTTGSLSFKQLKYAVDYFAKVETVEITGVLLRNPENKHRLLRSLKVTKFDGFDVKIDSPGVIVDAFWNTVLRVTRVTYEPVLKFAIEKSLKYIIDKEIEDRNKISG